MCDKTEETKTCEFCKKAEGKGFIIIGDGECLWVCSECAEKLKDM